jgi:hypothetical protein
MDLLVFFKTINYSCYLAHTFYKNSRFARGALFAVLPRSLTQFIFLFREPNFTHNKIEADQSICPSKVLSNHNKTNFPYEKHRIIPSCFVSYLLLSLTIFKAELTSGFLEPKFWDESFH